MRKLKLSIHAALLACLILLPNIRAGAAETITGSVVRVLDGDTVSVLTPQKEQLRVRLAEIDAPEKNQPFGMKAKKMLSDLIFAKDVSVLKIDTDRYGRTVGRIYQGHTDVNLEMVKAGGAWAYTKYQTDPAFRPAEDAARAGKLGLWALQEDQRMPPGNGENGRDNTSTPATAQTPPRRRRPLLDDKASCQ
jgi:endonuclease YncB( thermonuclease family)